MDFVHLRRFISKQSCWKRWSVQPSQPEVRAVSTAGAMAELRRTGHKPLPVSLHGSAGPSAVWGHSLSEHEAGKRRQIDLEQFSRCSLLAQTPSDADNGLVYCSLLAPWPLWSDMARYGRFPWFILLTFLLIHVAEARLTNSETEVFVAHMAQHGQVVFSHMSCIELLHGWGHGKKMGGWLSHCSLLGNLAPLMRVAGCADDFCDMNIFVEVLAALAIASSVLQVFLLTPCLLESGSRVKIDRNF